MKRLIATVAFFALASGALVASSAFAEEESDGCFKCHGSPDGVELRKVIKDHGRPLGPLILDPALWKRSMHGSLDCSDCHEGVEEHPHASPVKTMACAECHEEQANAVGTSVHGVARADGSGPRAACTDCHDVHGVLPKTDRGWNFHPLNAHLVCGKCHFSRDPAGMSVHELEQERYTDDAHARGILRQGLTVAPSCVTCHGGHEIRPRGDPEARTSKDNVASLCGSCHVGALEAYERSVHFKVGTKGERRGATCTDCHVPHDIDVHSHAFQTSAIDSCGRCHEERSSTYRQTYHGKVMALGEGGKAVATCSSCHDNHAILPASDPQSTINPAHLVETCGQCHGNVNRDFVQYVVHADPHDGEKNPKLHFVYLAMTWLLIGTFVVSILHALLWLVRGLAAREWRRPPVPKTARYFRRWPEFYSRLHVGMMTAFLMLAGTGLPLHFSDKPWATSVMSFLGGSRVASFVHRVGGLLLFLVIGAYLFHIGRRWLSKKEKGLWSGPNTMLPRWKDAQDVKGNVRWFLFMGPRPKFDRWTYWEKFDFWAVFWGIAVIGASGLMLWFPEEATVLLPGWMLNVAVIVHGHEALLAIGFIFTIHMFHTNLRPDKFPMDTMFFTGRISEEEMKRERPLEYERLKENGKLEEFLARRPRKRTRISAYVSGTIALAIGTSLVVAMIAAALGA